MDLLILVYKALQTGLNTSLVDVQNTRLQLNL